MSVPLGLYKAVEQIAEQRKVPKSEVLKDSLEQYIVSERNWQDIYQAGERSAQKLGIKGEKDVERLVEEYRNEQR